MAGLPYAFVQPIPRYSYLVYGILAYLAAQLLVDMLRVVRHRQQGGRPQTPFVTPAEVPGSTPPRASPSHL